MDHWQFFVEPREPPRIFKETSQHLPTALITLEVICVAKNTIRVLEIEERLHPTTEGSRFRDLQPKLRGRNCWNMAHRVN